ncbi:MAG: tRNA (adenosine(37)-N6)-threonylcarbamoyltransferase complex dimerization subunit type 1 TsaB [Spirochaetes bacterium]|nr:tRNA (adenosine(37)-N6)-threonylcarbamoyltransferase complex dimerization subunit type 1 TsaB [Spirochaetota bacterium]
MNILMIDASTDIEIICACSGRKCSDRTRRTERSHSVTLFENLDGCLSDIGLEIGDIDLIGVGTGPGSFTGIRIAVSTARMFSQLTGAPLIDLKSHLIFASSAAADDDSNVLVAFDAKKNRVFAALYNVRGPGEITELVRPGDYPLDLLLDHAGTGNKTVCIGDGIEKFYGMVAERLVNHEYLKDFVPSGIRACEIAEKAYLENPGLYKNYDRVVPNYTRRSDAEVMKDLKKKGN